MCVLLACSLQILSEVGKPTFVKGVVFPLWRRRRFPQEFHHNWIPIARYGLQLITVDDVVRLCVQHLRMQAVELSSELFEI